MGCSCRAVQIAELAVVLRGCRLYERADRLLPRSASQHPLYTLQSVALSTCARQLSAGSNRVGRASECIETTLTPSTRSRAAQATTVNGSSSGCRPDVWALR